MRGERERVKTKVEKIRWDHPFVAMGFIPEHLLREVWVFSASYWRKWLNDNEVPHRVINGVRWFHRDQLAEWFCSETGRRGSIENDDLGC